jgi:hypothetical protein
VGSGARPHFLSIIRLPLLTIHSKWSGQEMKYKKQHFVTASYIKAWCDPETQDGAFVWVVSKKDKNISRKSPKSLFVEDDFYTAYDPGGNRILELEHELKRMEDKFISLRDNKLKHHQPLTLEDRRDLALFISTMYARTKRQKEDGKQIWQDYVEMVEHLPPDMSKTVKNIDAYQDVIRVHKDQPMLFHLYQFVNITAPWLFSMNCAIYDTVISPGIITSDNPCFWFDPAVYNPKIPPTYFGVGSPTLMVLFPVSPKQFLIYEQNGYDGYIDLHSKPADEEDFVDTINRFTALNCDELIVVNEKTYKETWFEEVTGI